MYSVNNTDSDSSNLNPDVSDISESKKQDRIKLHKKEILATLELLIDEGIEEEMILFPYLMMGVIWSEESHLEVLELGFKLWLEAYEGSNFAWMASSEDIDNDPENPINSPLFTKLVKLRERVKQIKESNLTQS